MGKTKIGSMRQKILVQGDINLLEPNEILVTQSEGYTVLREKDCNRNIKTYVVVPLEEFAPKTEKVTPKKTTKNAKKNEETQTNEP